MAKIKSKGYPANGTNAEKYWYVYEKAKELGDKFPEVTASQFALESGYGTSDNAVGLNNPFGQTAHGDKPGNRKWKKYETIDHSIKDHVRKWAPKYAHARDPISAMAIIQPSYAPSKDGNSEYMKTFASIMKSNGMYKGDVNIPNADKMPEFYGKNRGLNESGYYSYTADYIDKSWTDYNKKLKEINNLRGKEPDAYVNQQLENLQMGYQREGLLPMFNNKIDVENKKLEEKYNNNVNGLRSLVDFVNDPDLINSNDVGDNKVTVMLDQKNPKVIALLKSNPEFKKYFIPQSGVDFVRDKNTGFLPKEVPYKKYKVVIPKKDNGQNLFSELQKKIQKFSGNKEYQIYDDKGILSEDSLVPGTSSGILRNGPLTDTRFSLPQYTIKKFNGQEMGRPKLAPLDMVPEAADEEPIPEAQLSTTDPTQYTESDIKAIEEVAARKKQVTQAKVATAPETGVADDYFATDMKAPVVTGDEEFKDNFPYADILQAGVGIFAGLDMANKSLPMRDERVSDAIMNYTAELSRLSKMGLRPEDEAYAKRNLSESYQSGLDSITHASGGNRNIVLGNLGRLDSQKQRGLMELSVADAQMKNDALFKYGEAVKYINEFDANRDIANNERKYANAVATKEAGANLASAGFKSLIDNINYYKENKPGSANAMTRSYLYRDMFNVDPTLKDDGSGTVPYTLSWKKKQDEAKVAGINEYNDARTKFNSLTPEKQRVVSSLMDSDTNPKDIYGVVDFLHNNDPQKPLNMKNLPNAAGTGDYGILFSDLNNNIDAPKVKSVFNDAANNVQNIFDEITDKDEHDQPKAFDFLQTQNNIV